MSGVQQSGGVTPGHAAAWVTDGVIADAGMLPTAQRVLAVLKGADFNTTDDQILTLPAAIAAFAITNIIITNALLSLTNAVGGFYPAAAKAGTPIVAASQVYSTLTLPTKLLNATLASFGSTTRFSVNNLTNGGEGLEVYFALTTIQGAPATADIYLIGMDLT